MCEEDEDEDVSGLPAERSAAADEALSPAIEKAAAQTILQGTSGVLL